MGEMVAFTVKGDAVTLRQCTQAMANVGPSFTYGDLQRAMSLGGVPPSVVARAADRLLQYERRQGRIAYRKHGRWEKSKNYPNPLSPTQSEPEK